MVINNTSTIWKALKGIICVYKPAETPVRKVRAELIHKIISELNYLDQNLRFPSDQLAIEGNTSKELVVSGELNLANHPMVIGPKYHEDDLIVSWSNFLGWNSSGVLLLGLRSGTAIAKYIRENRPTRSYQIKAVFGKATETGFKNAKCIERSTWRYIKQFHIDRMLSAMQAAHQKKMFEMSGVDMQSQLAYELAVKGPIRPANSKIPVIYGLKCTEFTGPEFTIEIQCINEYETYLAELVREIGLKLHSTAYVDSIKCIRHSCFTLEHALLPKYFNLQNIVANLALCGELLGKHEHLLDQDSVALRQ